MRTLISILVLALATSMTFGAEKSAPAATPSAGQQAKPKFRPFHGTIKTYDKTAKAVILNGAKAQTFAIIGETKINKDGKPTTVDALVAGETVGGRARQTADGRWEALTLNLGKKPDAASKPEKPKKN